MQNWFDYTSQPGRTLEGNEMVGARHPLVSVITPYYNVGEVFETNILLRDESDFSMV